MLVNVSVDPTAKKQSVRMATRTPVECIEDSPSGKWVFALMLLASIAVASGATQGLW